MIQIKDNHERLSFWQLVFLQSKVNGAVYHGEELPRHKWEWPQNTYFQRRLSKTIQDRSMLMSFNLSRQFHEAYGVR